MRVLLRATVPVEAGNKAIQEGTMGKIVGSVVEQIKPEACYFLSENGNRTGYFFFDLQDSSQIPAIAEPLFNKLNAKVEIIPVMNQEELGKGLQAL